MSYQQARDAVFAGASRCASDRAPVEVHNELAVESDVERAFKEWQEGGGSGVALRLTTNLSGHLVAEFTPT